MRSMRLLDRPRSLVTLLRWLGPWASSTRAPAVAVRDREVAGLRVRTYAPLRPPPRASPFLIAPGLHYAGADDPRLDRFCRILAAAGHEVTAPFIPDYLALTPCERAKTDFARVLLAQAVPPVVFSISFGSLLALAAAAEHPAAVAGLVLFGGYADFRATMRFCLSGAARDPLNQPVVLLNLFEQLAPADPAALGAAWRRYVERTWGRPELKERARYVAIAQDLAAGVPERVRELFLVGVGALPGAAVLAEAALDRFDARALDPAPYLARIRGRVDLVHGTDDDVIPYAQSQQLAAGLVNAEPHLHITGLYGHTGAALPRLGSVARELATLLRVVWILLQ